MTTVTAGGLPIGAAVRRAAPWLRNRWVVRSASLVLVLGLWQLFGNPLSTSFPDAIARAFPSHFWHSVLPAIGDTLKGLGLGYVICIVVGIPLGLLMARSRIVELALEPYVAALYATPRLALIPVLILWFGINFNLRLAVTIVSGLFPIVLNAYLGARDVDKNLIDAGKAFAAGPFQTVRTIVLPASLPYVFAGMRLGMARAFIGIIVAEIETSSIGIGNLLNQDVQALHFADMWVGIVTLGLFSMLFTGVLKAGERWTTEPWLRKRRTLPWR